MEGFSANQTISTKLILLATLRAIGKITLQSLKVPVTRNFTVGNLCSNFKGNENVVIVKILKRCIYERIDREIGIFRLLCLRQDSKGNFDRN